MKIMIIKVPRGEAPEWVRRAWVGLVLPCSGVLSGPGVGVLTGKPSNHGKKTYRAPQDAALKILAQTEPEAVDWWRALGYPKQGKTFGFCEDEVMILPEENQNPNAWG